MAGFQINAIYNNNNTSSAAAATQTGTPTGDNVAYGAGINYVIQKFNLDLAYQNLKNTTFATQGGVSAAAAFPTGGSAFAAYNFNPMNPFGTANSQAQMYAGATYDFGMLKAYAQFIDSKVQSNLNGNNFVQRTAQQIGVRGNFTPTIEAWASGGNGRLTAGASQAVTMTVVGVTQNFTGYQVGANYILSKRTNLYGIYGSTQVSSSSISATESRAAYGVGLRHTF
jgi:predicted porin